jgi:hypothetical protein
VKPFGVKGGGLVGVPWAIFYPGAHLFMFGPEPAGPPGIHSAARQGNEAQLRLF